MILAKKSSRIYVKVGYEERDNVRRHLKGATWSPHDKSWVVTASISTYRNLLKLCVNDELNPDKLGPEMRAWITHIKKLANRLTELQKGESEASKEIGFPEGFALPIKPFLHQSQAVAYCMNLPKAALWLDLGLGKTFTSILVARLRHFKKQVRSVLVLAPKSLLRQWDEEIKRFTPSTESVSVHICSGTPKNKALAIADFKKARHKENHLGYLLCTYESVGNLAEDLYLSTDMFILDESTKIKNPMAVRTKNTVDLCGALPYGLALTGLAYLNNPRDLYSQILALDPTVYGSNVWEFGNEYLRFTKMGERKIPSGVKNLKELKSRAYYIAFSRKKEDCLDLPAKVYQVRTLSMYPDQKKYYDEIVVDLKEQLTIKGRSVTAPGTLAKLEKLAQILAGFIRDDEGETIWLDSPKYDEMVDIIESSSDSFVVWGRHRAVLERIGSTLKKAKISHVVLSSLGQQEADIAKKSFKKGMFKVMVCQINSESKGLNLTGERPVSTIYLENSMSIDDRWQSESRTHRIGMTGTATYVDLCIEDTLDESVLLMLKSKLKVSDYIATYGLDALFGKGGSVSTPKLKMKGVKGSSTVTAREEEELDVLMAKMSETKIEGFD